MPPEKEYGIYQNWKDCEKINVETKTKEHFINVKNGEIEISVVAAHLWKKRHTMDLKPILLKQ